ncbi:MAG TPA: class I SAM-dependent methyltransferase [Acidimicrobiales bacterium]|jgi:SAM-dependent methyltransferase|nr:class I SAM-dependent methyltransferase [Acidimicrobiales bacterium]
MGPQKRYDRAYFDRWYRRHDIGRAADVRRVAHFVLATTEHLLERPVRSVLDVGCGEAAWRKPLLDARPHLRYLGVDPSTYVVQRYGRTRDIRLGGIGDLPALGLRGDFDVVVCTDVLPYVPLAEMRTGIGWIAGRLAGLAYLHAMTSVDAFIGDRAGFIARSPAAYERAFAAAGLRRIGPHLYAGPTVLPTLAALEGPLRRS